MENNSRCMTKLGLDFALKTGANETIKQAAYKIIRYFSTVMPSIVYRYTDLYK
jgi:hypothetical protein